MPEHKPEPTYWPLIILLLVLWGFLQLYGNAPFFGHHDANGVWLGSAARNLRLYDLREISLVPLPTRGPIPLDPVSYYVNHPPLVVWLSALAQSIWGDTALSLRLVSTFSTMVALAGFYVFCRRLYGARMGLLCAALYGFTPFTIYFGRMPNHEPLTLAFLMLFLATYVQWTRTKPRRPDRNTWLCMAAMAFGGIWTAWAAFFFVMSVSFIGLWAVKPSQRPALVMLGGVGVLAVVTVMGFYTLSYPPTLSELVEAFLWRTSTTTEIKQALTWPNYAGQVLIYLIAGATLALVLMVIPGLPRAWRDARPLNRSLLIALLAAGLGYNVLFRSASYVHDYYFMFLLPFVVIVAVHGIVALIEGLSWQVRPALVGLFIASTLGGLALMRGWYNTDYHPFGLQFAEWVAVRSEPADLVITNVGGPNPSTEYYAFRKFRWNVPVENFMDVEVPDGATAVYMHCLWADPEQTISDMTAEQMLEACTIVNP